MNPVVNPKNIVVVLLFRVNLIGALVTMPIPFELSIADHPSVSCKHTEEISNEITSASISLCFGNFEEPAAKVSHLFWRSMSTSISLDNGTFQIELKVRRVSIFAAGASFKMAGSQPVSVFSLIKDLELGTHYNGFGNVSGPAKDSIIFRGELTDTVFEGQILYQNLTRSHSIQCFHNDSLKPDFYESDRCLVCNISTFNTTHKPVAPIGWRSNSLPPCETNISTSTGQDHTDASNDALHANLTFPDQGSEVNGMFGFPLSDYFGYAPSSGTKVKTNRNNTEDVENENSNGTAKTDSQNAPDVTLTEARAQRRPQRSMHSPALLSGRIKPKGSHGAIGKLRRSLRSLKSPRLEPSPTIRKERRSSSQSRSQSLNDSFMETVSCSLHLVADHLFFSDMGERSPAKTVNLMLSVVIGADAVFRATDFDGDGVRDNIGFVVKNITIIHNSSTAFYGYSRANGNSFEYLKSFSTGDFSDVCLGVAFTAIDFQRSVVGLAWYASTASGGAGRSILCILFFCSHLSVRSYVCRLVPVSMTAYQCQKEKVNIPFSTLASRQGASYLLIFSL